MEDDSVGGTTQGEKSQVLRKQRTPTVGQDK